MFDVIGVGTSPLMLMRALKLAQQDLKVLLCDRSPIAGGAWTAYGILGFDNVEDGVHFLENRPALLSALGEGLSLEMTATDCLALVGGRRVPMGLCRILLQGGAGLKAGLRREPDKLVRSFRSTALACRHVLQGFHYPRGGAGEMVRRLHDRLLEAGGQVRLGTDVSRIEVEGSTARCVTDGGTEQTARVLLASRAFAPVYVGGEPISISTDRTSCRTAIVHVRTPGPPAATYVEVLGDPRLKRMRDLTGLVRPTPPAGEHVVAVQYRSRRDQDDMELGASITSDLEDLGILRPGSEPIAAFRREIDLVTATSSALQQIATRSCGVVSGLRTTDFADGFALAPGLFA